MVDEGEEPCTDVCFHVHGVRWVPPDNLPLSHPLPLAFLPRHHLLLELKVVALFAPLQGLLQAW